MFLSVWCDLKKLDPHTLQVGYVTYLVLQLQFDLLDPPNNIRTLIKVLDKVFVHNFVRGFLNTWHN